MENMSESWFSDMLQDMDDPLFMIDQMMMDKLDMTTFEDDFLPPARDDFPATLSSGSNSSRSNMIHSSHSANNLCGSPGTMTSTESQPPPPATITGGATATAKRPSKQRKRKHTSSSDPVILSFSNSSNQMENEIMNNAEEVEVHEEFPKVGPPATTKNSSSRVRPPSQIYDHIIAERKRRGQLSQLFVALAALVPGLKKMDKNSVLGDAINYLKDLQGRVKKFEEQTVEQNMESVVVIKKSQLLMEEEEDGDEGKSSCEEGSCENIEPLQEIGASVSGKTILFRIRCGRQKGLLVKILSQIENLNLTVANTSVAQFGSLVLDVTIIAEMEEDFGMSVKDVVRKLQTSLRHT